MRAGLQMSRLLISTNRPPGRSVASDPATMPLEVRELRTMSTPPSSASSEANTVSREPSTSRTPSDLKQHRQFAAECQWQGPRKVVARQLQSRQLERAATMERAGHPPDQGPLVAAASGGNGDTAHRPHQLNGRQPDTTGGSMDQHPVSGLARGSVAEGRVHRDEHRGRRGSGLEAKVGGDQGEGLRAADHVGSQASSRQAKHRVTCRDNQQVCRVGARDTGT